MISKRRLLWAGMPASAGAAVEELIGAHVIRAQSCPGGFSPGFASRLTLSNGRRVFVKAMNAQRWPLEAVTYRTEALVAAARPAQVPAPRFLKTLDDGHWTVLAFEDIDGTTPSQPWDRASLDRVAAAVVQLT
ncbi:hypothetical protein [Micromonospora sp. NPDC005173]|uniref:hypothetical protein n=1 Tax=Micromonospora sp. NPDC005173 TaxID=3157165 RepID=UPI0033BAAE3F